jgi:hypothetical protein
VTSISLPAGDWDLAGVIFSTGASISVTNTIATYFTATNTRATAVRWAIHTFLAVVPGCSLASVEILPRYHLGLSGTTTIFLIAQSAFTISTNAAWGQTPAPAAR